MKYTIKNQGKIFEEDWKKSIEDYMYYERLSDQASGFNFSSELRFSISNPYDHFIFVKPNLFTLEQKSTEGTGITYWDERFVSPDKEKAKKQSFMIKKCQRKGLEKSGEFNGVISGFVLNFRKTNHTYFLSIDKFNKMVKDFEKKSFNESDVLSMSAYLIDQTLKKIHYRYNIEKFIIDMQKIYNE